MQISNAVGYGMYLDLVVYFTLPVLAAVAFLIVAFGLINAKK